MNIGINIEYGEDKLAGYKILELAEFVLRAQGKPDNTEVSISFVDNDTIAKLNEEYRGIVGPTDVLSFECDGIADENELFAANVVENSPIFELGDIIIAPDVAYAQCEQYGNTFKQEVALLLTHGLLHLCGYDHMTDEEAQVMETQEKELLSKWFKTEFIR